MHAFISFHVYQVLRNMSFSLNYNPISWLLQIALGLVEVIIPVNQLRTNEIRINCTYRIEHCCVLNMYILFSCIIVHVRVHLISYLPRAITFEGYALSIGLE